MMTMTTDDLNQVKIIVFEATMPLKNDINSIREELVILREKMCGNGYAKRIADLEQKIEPLNAFRWKTAGAVILIMQLVTIATVVVKFLR